LPRGGIDLTGHDFEYFSAGPLLSAVNGGRELSSPSAGRRRAAAPGVGPPLQWPARYSNTGGQISVVATPTPTRNTTSQEESRMSRPRNA
jgi:hypothetical protein